MANDEAIEVVVQLSGGLYSTAKSDQALKVLHEVDIITEVLDQTKSLISSFITRTKNGKASAKPVLWVLGFSVSYQQLAALGK